jgi:spermidine synthase
MNFRRPHSFLATAILLLGFISLVTQTVLLREFLSVFAGNELVIGIVLANWMILTGVGAYLGQYAKHRFFGSNWIIVFLTLVSVTPIFILLILQFLRNLVFPIGVVVGIAESFAASLLLLVPYCLPSGFLFTLLCRGVSEEYRSNLISRVYAIEAVGAVIGGLLVNLIAIQYLSTYQILLVLCAASLLVTFLLALARWGRRSVVLFGGLTLVLIAALSLTDIEGLANQALFPGQTITYRKDTPFGNLTVTRQAEQLNFFENGVLMFSTNDVSTSEEAVHYAMAQRAAPRRVLLISGGVSGIPREILKYPVDTVEYVEVNPWLIALGREHIAALHDRRIHVIVDDARRYLRTVASTYDVVLIETPDPATAQLNRYYTVEFLREVKARMSPAGVLSFSVLPSAEYLGPEARRISSVIYGTLRAVFRDVILVPGLRNYYIASDSSLDVRAVHLVETRGIPTTYVNKYYVDDEILAERSAVIMANLVGGEGLNEDYRPLAYYEQLLYWMSYFKFNPSVLAIFLGLVVVVLAYRLHPVSFGIFATGFAASSVEFLLLFSFQVVLGYLYQFVGLLITIFMAGLAVGAWYAHRRFGVATIKRFVVLQLLIALAVVALPWVLCSLRSASMSGLALQSTFLLLTGTMAILVGMEFALAVPLLQGSIMHVASELYGFDLVGSAIGVLVVTVFLLPLLGLANVCYIVAGISLSAAVLTLVRSKKL